MTPTRCLGSLLVVLGAACSGPAEPAQTLPDQPTPMPTPGGVMHADLEVTSAGVGPIVASTRLDRDTIGALLPGYTMGADNDEFLLVMDTWPTGVERWVLRFYPVTGAPETIKQIEIRSPEITVAGSTWRVDGVFSDLGSVDTCGCSRGSRTCFRAGEHVAVGIDASCNGDHTPGSVPIDGKKIDKVVWSATPLQTADDL